MEIPGRRLQVGPSEQESFLLISELMLYMSEGID
jgi:hypothetical protein